MNAIFKSDGDSRYEKVGLQTKGPRGQSRRMSLEWGLSSGYKKLRYPSRSQSFGSPVATWAKVLDPRGSMALGCFIVAWSWDELGCWIELVLGQS